MLDIKNIFSVKSPCRFYSHTYNDALCAKRNFKKVTTVDLQQQCRGTYVCISAMVNQ